MKRIVLWSVTLTRIALIPVFVMLALRAQDVARAGLDPSSHRWGVVLVLAVIGLSDIVDGWMARRYGLASQAGAIVDALADKLAQVTVAGFFALSRGPAFLALPVWFLGIVVARDLVLAGGWVALRARRLPSHVVHRPHGRAATVSVFVVLFWLALALPPGGLIPVLVFSSATIIASTSAYVLEGWARVSSYHDEGEEVNEHEHA